MLCFPSLTRTSVLTAVAALALTPAAASAGTVTVDAAGTLVFTATAGEANRLGVQARGDGSGGVSLYDSRAAITGDIPASCTRPGWGDSSIDCAVPAAVRVELGDGNDEGYVSFDVKVPVTIIGGDGDDALEGNDATQTLDGGPGNDKIAGYEGDDTLLGGDGNDTLDGAAGHDKLDAGAGDDTVSGDGVEGQYTDLIDGGPGTDQILTEWGDRFNPSSPQPNIGLTLGGGADDGRPGEGDDVRSIERVAINVAGDYTGTDAAEEITVRQVLGATRLTGGGGNDTLKAPDGPDTVDGGPGDDLLDAGFGDDTVIPGPGRDTVYADTRGGDCGPAWCKTPYGNDTVLAYDGEPDSISCGAGTDTVVADPIDTVATDCETLDRKAGVPLTPSQGQGPAVTPQKTTLRQAMARGVKLRISGATPGKTLKLALKLKARTVATGSAKVSSKGNATVTVRFSRSGKRALRGKRQATFSIVGAGLGTTTLTLGAKA